jgi:hypothetical protein
MTYARLWKMARLTAAGAALAIVTTASALGSASDAAAASEHIAPVFSHFADTGAVTPSNIPCVGGQAIHGSATFGQQQGDTWRGNAEYDFCLKPGPVANTLVYSGTGMFTGQVAGCGTGSMKYEVKNGFVRQEQNPVRPNGYEEWSVLPGTGTGGLASVSEGSGVGIYTIQPTLANQGFFAGSLVCVS